MIRLIALALCAFAASLSAEEAPPAKAPAAPAVKEAAGPVQAAAPAGAALPVKMPESFKADMVMQGGGRTMDGKVFVSGKKTRMEMKAEGQEMVTIVKQDERTVTMLMPAMKMQMQMPFQAEMIDPSRDEKASWTKVGTETVEGVACDKYEVTNGKDTGLMWVDPKTQAPVRMSDKEGKGSVTYKNLVVGPVDAALFEVPSDYKSMGDMGGFGGAGQPGGQDGKLPKPRR